MLNESQRIQFPAAIVIRTCKCFKNIQAFNLMFLKLNPNITMNLYSLQFLLLVGQEHVGKHYIWNCPGINKEFLKFFSSQFAIPIRKNNGNFLK